MRTKRSTQKKPMNPKSDFRCFLSLLDERRELVRINKVVSTKFELAAVVSKLEGKQAILFEKIDKSQFKVACNVIGTRRRFSLVMGKRNLIDSHFLQLDRNISEPEKTPETAPFYENSSKVLSELPIVTHFEKDAGPYITSSIVFAKDPEKGTQNASTHRLLKIDDQNMVIRMVEGRHLHKCYCSAIEHGDDLKVAISIGVHPAVSIAAAYQAAYGVDEMLIANSLLDGELTVSKNIYSQLYIPTCSEIVLEGRILKDKTEYEWMVEMLRTYDFKQKQPIFELDRIRFRTNAISGSQKRCSNYHSCAFNRWRK